MLVKEGFHLASSVHPHKPQRKSLSFVHSYASTFKPIALAHQIDGHRVYAAEGDVDAGGSVPSHATAIVTTKGRWVYAFTVIHYGKRATPKEIHAALTAIFGARLD